MLLAVAVVGAAVAMEAQSPRALEAELRAAQYRERIQGDVTGAIATYQRLALSSDRAVASNALLLLAEAYDRIGSGDALATFARVSREFADMRAAATARRRLDAQKSTGPVQRVLISGDAANEEWGSVSFDGRYLPYQDPETGNVAFRDLTNGRSRLATRSKGYVEGFTEVAVWSPDGHQLAYSWWHDEPDKPNVMQLRVVGRDNGVSRVLYTSPDLNWMQPLAWSPDGKSILAALDLKTGMQLGLVSNADGSFTSLKSGTSVTRAEFSPDGRFVVYDHPASTIVPMGEINIIDLATKTDRPLVTGPDHDFLLGWAPDGRHLLFGSDRLTTPGAWALLMTDGRAQGEPQLIKADIGRTSSLGFDSKGRFYSKLSVAGNDVFIAEIDPATGKMTQQARPAPKGQPIARRSQGVWSPDGRQLIYAQEIPGRGVTLVVQTVATGELNIKPTTLRNLTRPFWFPDGSAVAVLAHEPERSTRGIFRIDLRSGAVSPMLVPAQNFAGMARDGEFILYTRGQAIVKRRLADGVEQEVVKGTAGTMTLSNDTQWIARFKGASIVVSPIAGGTERLLVENVPGGLKRVSWSHDDQFVFFVSSNREIWRVPAAGGAAVDTGVRSELTRLLTVSHDGRRLALTGGAARVEVWMWENLLPRR